MFRSVLKVAEIRGDNQRLYRRQNIIQNHTRPRNSAHRVHCFWANRQRDQHNPGQTNLDCPLSCIFCSTDAGPKSRWRQTEYIVDLDYLVEELDKVIGFKGRYGIEAHIDTVGDPPTYPRIVDLVQKISEIKGVEVISMQTHGALLTHRLAEELDAAGLSRLNLSIDALDPELAKFLSGIDWYDVLKVAEVAEYIA